MDRLLNIEEVAERLGSSVKTVRRRVKKGLIPAIQEGGRGTQLRFDWDDVLTAIQSHPAANEMTEKPETKLSGPKPKWKRELDARRRRQKTSGEEV
jgi:excisionase family DNA binding protein